MDKFNFSQGEASREKVINFLAAVAGKSECTTERDLLETGHTVEYVSVKVRVTTPTGNKLIMSADFNYSDGANDNG